jgi:hypothetical protein
MIFILKAANNRSGDLTRKSPAIRDRKIKSFFGGKPKYEACDTFVRQPGISGMVAGAAGAPPEWTDRPKK